MSFQVWYIQASLAGARYEVESVYQPSASELLSRRKLHAHHENAHAQPIGIEKTFEFYDVIHA